MSMADEMRQYINKISIFDASYFPQEEHAKCAMLEEYLNGLVTALAANPGRLTADEWDKIMDDITLIHADPMKFVYMFFLMLNSIVISAVEIELMAKVMNDMFTSGSPIAEATNDYL